MSEHEALVANAIQEIESYPWIVSEVGDAGHECREGGPAYVALTCNGVKIEGAGYPPPHYDTPGEAVDAWLQAFWGYCGQRLTENAKRRVTWRYPEKLVIRELAEGGFNVWSRLVIEKMKPAKEWKAPQVEDGGPRAQYHARVGQRAGGGVADISLVKHAIDGRAIQAGVWWQAKHADDDPRCMFTCRHRDEDGDPVDPVDKQAIAQALMDALWRAGVVPSKGARRDRGGGSLWWFPEDDAPTGGDRAERAITHWTQPDGTLYALPADADMVPVWPKPTDPVAARDREAAMDRCRRLQAAHPKLNPQWFDPTSPPEETIDHPDGKWRWSDAAGQWFWERQPTAQDRFGGHEVMVAEESLKAGDPVKVDEHGWVSRADGAGSMSNEKIIQTAFRALTKENEQAVGITASQREALISHNVKMNAKMEKNPRTPLFSENTDKNPKDPWRREFHVPHSIVRMWVEGSTEEGFSVALQLDDGDEYIVARPTPEDARAIGCALISMAHEAEIGTEPPPPPSLFAETKAEAVCRAACADPTHKPPTHPDDAKKGDWRWCDGEGQWKWHHHPSVASMEEILQHDVSKTY